MFTGISRVGLCLVAILGYCLVAGIALAINSKIRSARATTGRAPRVDVDTTRRS
jgi:hypothetical protein